MGKVVGGIGLSHVPSIGPVVDRARTQEPAWKPLFDAYVPVREWLAKLKPDVAIVVYTTMAPILPSTSTRPSRLALPSATRSAMKALAHGRYPESPAMPSSRRISRRR